MGMVAPYRGIGSAFFVCFGKYGDVCRFAQEQGVSRQWVYREARQVAATLAGEGREGLRQEIQRLHGEVALLRAQLTQTQTLLDQSVLVDAAKQAEFACVGQACGVTLAQGRTLLRTLICKPLSVAALGRATHEMGQKAGTLLAVLDEFTRPRVQDVAADEIYVKDPTLMIVEQGSLCWVCGQLSADVSGETWSAQFSQLPNMQQVARDAGKGLAKGVALVNAQRQEKGQEPLVDQEDHFHAFRPGGVGLGRLLRRAQKALTQADEAQKDLENRDRQGQALTGPTSRARFAWLKAEQAMDEWAAAAKAWTQTKEALRLITPEGELNTRAKAQAKLAETLPHLPEADFAKAKRQVQHPQMLSYLDRVEKELGKLQIAAEVKQAAIDQEALRRRPELLQGKTTQAAARRGVLLMCAVTLSKAGEAGTKAAEAVREIFRRAHRASSLVECINSVLRMHQAQHRKMSQAMVDLKRLYWNSHEFRTGHRRGKTPYQLLGVPWPEGISWWALLKLTPEQLRETLSTTNTAA
jgi:hypothetical protein